LETLSQKTDFYPNELDELQNSLRQMNKLLQELSSIISPSIDIESIHGDDDNCTIESVKLNLIKQKLLTTNDLEATFNAQPYRKFELEVLPDHCLIFDTSSKIYFNL